MPSVGSPLKQILQVVPVLQPGFTPSNPGRVLLSMGDVYAYEVEIDIPPGPKGQVGFYLEYAGTPLVPHSNTPHWIVVDDYQRTFPLDTELGSSLVFVYYNLGVWQHNAYLRFTATPIAAYVDLLAQAPPQPIDLSTVGQ